jgi:hypothetical protein
MSPGFSGHPPRLLHSTKTCDMMQLDAKLLKISAIAFVLIGLISCNGLVKSGLGVTPINAIEQNWEKHSKVYVKGTVQQVVPFVDSAAYQLADDSGNIWVFIQKDAPPKLGEQVLIQGQVKYQSIPISGREFGEVYLEQVKRMELNETQK